MIYFVVPRSHEFGIRDYFESSWGDRLAAQVTVLHYEDLPNRTAVPAGTYIFTGLEQLTAGGARLVSELQNQLRASPHSGPVFNDPRSTLLRFELLEELHRRGLNPHRVVRATADFGGLRFPVFLREVVQHSGSLSPLLRSRAELDQAVGRAVLQGYRLRELMVVEFCDTVDKHGLYRKYTAYVVGSEVIARGMARGREWMLKAEAVEFSEAMLLEERDYVFANPYEGQLRGIFELARVGFGRIDYAVRDGQVITWEINLLPTMGPPRQKVMPDSFAPMRQPIRDHFNQRLHAALQAADSSAFPVPIAVAYSEEYSDGALPVVRPPSSQGTLVRIARALHPMRPLLNWAARSVSPLVARVVRRLQ